jgi:hypothetical protein
MATFIPYSGLHELLWNIAAEEKEQLMVPED